MLTMLQSGKMQEVYTNTMWQTRKGILANNEKFQVQVKYGSTGSRCGSKLMWLFKTHVLYFIKQ